MGYRKASTDENDQCTTEILEKGKTDPLAELNRKILEMIRYLEMEMEKIVIKVEKSIQILKQHS